MAASTSVSDPAAAAVLSLVDYGWTPDGASQPALRDVTLRLAPGECALLTGRTGAGKSTLLRAIAGALPTGGAARGSLEVAGHATLLFQNVDTQLLFSTVEEEVASGLRTGLDDADAAARVEAALASVGLPRLARRTVEDLSAGERQRVVLAALLASEPSLLLLDEPTSALDRPARARLAQTLAQLKAFGHSLVIAEHVAAPFRALVDRSFAIANGCVRERPLAQVDRPWAPGTLRSVGNSGRLLVRCRAAAVADPDGSTRLRATDLEVHEGERLVVDGPNGAGKSTLLRLLAGLLPASAGDVDFDDALRPIPCNRSAQLAGRIALVLQSPPRNLFAHSVAEEIAFTLERAGWPAARIDQRVGELLAACDLAHASDRSPLRLSFGEQHRIAIAAALAAQPALLLLDEPFSGLDLDSRAQLLDLLEREQARTGMTVVIATHDPEEIRAWTHREISLQPTRLAPKRPHPHAPFAMDRAQPHARRAAAGRACHFRDTGSPLHRMAVGWKLLAVTLGSALAIAVHAPSGLALLLGCWLAGYRLARLSTSELWQDMRWLLAQGVVIVALSTLRDGTAGAWAGLRAASQIALFFLPGALLLRTTPVGRLLASVRRALPPRLAFALATSLRMIPFFARELDEIVSAQRLRGARLWLRDAWRPRAWRDAIECVGVPLAVRAIHTANEVASAAEVRGIAAIAAEESTS